MHDLNALTEATTTVRIELSGRPALIKDVQHALDTLLAEGIPDTFEISFHQSEERDSSSDLPYSERPIVHRMWIEARRASKTPAAQALGVMAR